MMRDRIGSGDLRPLVLAHGFTQNSRCWGAFEPALLRHLPPPRPVIAVDLPGHGESAFDEADLDEAGARLVDTAGEQSIVLGYSMGGRIALHGALAHPDRVAALILIGATAGIEGPAERAARRARDEDLASRLIVDGVSTFLDGWLANPLFAGLNAESHCRSERETNRADGLATSLRNCGTGTQRLLLGELGALSMPVLVLAGEADTKFIDEGQKLTNAIGENCEMNIIGSAGHACHLESPTTTAATIATWLTP